MMPHEGARWVLATSCAGALKVHSDPPWSLGSRCTALTMPAPQPPPYLGQEVHKLAGSAPALMRGAGWEPCVFACESAAVPVELWVPHAHRPWLHLCCASATLVLVLTRTSMSQVPQTAQ